MRLSIISYNGNLINDGTNFQAFFPEGTVMLQQPSEAIELLRPNNVPLYSGQLIPEGHTVPIVVKMLGTISTQIDTLKSYFNTHDEVAHKLLVKDLANSNKEWHIYAKTTRMVDHEGQSVTFILSTPDPIWREETESSDIWGITATGQTHALTVGGNVNTHPRFVVTPTSTGTSGWAYKRFITAYNNTANALVDYPLEVTGVIDTAALTSAGKVQADGDDLRVVIDGAEVNRWIEGINTTQTKVWVVTSFQPKVEMLLGTALGTGTEAVIELKNNRTQLKYIKQLPESGMVQIDSEIFTYSSKDNKSYELTIDSRAAKQTSTAAHSIAATVRWIEHEILLFYGSATMEAPVTDDTYKPIINMATSTNLLWDYDEFTDKNGLRAGSWRPTVWATTNTRDTDHATEFYEANHGTHADPAVEMGMSLKAWQNGTKWVAETGKVCWQVYNPCTFYKVTAASGEKYRAASSWPSNSRLWGNNGGTGYGFVALWATEATPTTAATWTAWTKTNQSFTAYKYLRYTFSGTIAGAADNAAYVEISDITLALTTASVPTISLASESNNTNLLKARITNNTTSEWLEIDYNLALNQSIIVDCDEKTAQASDGQNAISAVTFSSVRRNWLDLKAGTNTLQFDLPNTGDITMTTYWRDRNS